MAREHRKSEDRYNWNLARGDITAFGESKPIKEWSQDHRCVVTRESLRTRLALGWRPEDAITTPKSSRPSLGPFTYHGQTKTLSEWADFLGLKYHTLYRRMYKDGLSFEEAVEKMTKDTIQWVMAFGETKPIEHWAVDPRARVSATTLRKRLIAGWNPEQAITEEPENQPRLGLGTVYEAFGKRHTIPEWAKLSGLPEGKMRQYITKTSGTVEQALLFYDWYPEWIDRYFLVVVTLGGLRPGDVIVAVEDNIVTVRRDRLRGDDE